MVLNTSMTYRRFLPLVACLLLPACQQNATCITDIADLPVKEERAPEFDLETSPLRANAQYILFEANSRNSRRLLKGDYYFVNWYDAEPQHPVRIVMHYTQSATGEQVKQVVKEYKEPREKAGYHKEHFFFNGPERDRQGDIMSWRIELYSNGVLKDARQSYLWE